MVPGPDDCIWEVEPAVMRDADPEKPSTGTAGSPFFFYLSLFLFFFSLSISSLSFWISFSLVWSFLYPSPSSHTSTYLVPYLWVVRRPSLMACSLSHKRFSLRSFSSSCVRILMCDSMKTFFWVSCCSKTDYISLIWVLKVLRRWWLRSISSSFCLSTRSLSSISFRRRSNSSMTSVDPLSNLEVMLTGVTVKMFWIWP